MAEREGEEWDQPGCPHRMGSFPCPSCALGTETAREEDPLRPFFCADTGSLTEAEKAIHSKYQDTDPDGDYFDPAPAPSPGAPDEAEVGSPAWALRYAKTYWQFGKEPETQAALTALAQLVEEIDEDRADRLTRGAGGSRD